MPTYKYVAVNLEKKKFKGIYIAEDEHDLAVQLTKLNLYLVSSKVYESKTPNAFFTLGTGKVKMSELTTFCRQFAIMLSTGIPLIDCIDSLKQQAYTAYFKSVLQVISEDLKGGAVLSESIDKHKKIFPEFFCSMVHVGEVSGKLDQVFVSLADYYESDASIKRKVKAALSYPSMLALMTLGIVVVMLAFVIPTFRDSLSQLDVELTGLTLGVYQLSDFVLNYWRIMVISIIGFALLLLLIFKLSKGKKFMDMLKIKLPVVGKIQTHLITARFARAFGILLSSGMDLASALDTTSIILGNNYIKERFDEAAEDVRQGISLTDAFQKQGIFPAMLLQMLAVGEKTASLEEVLTRSCVFFDEQVDVALSKLTSKIQPIMLMIMGAVVGTLFIAIYSPMLAIMGTLA